MRGEDIPQGGARAADDIHHAGRQVGGLQQLVAIQRGQGVALGGDEDGRVAAGDGGGQQRDEGEQRIALRADDADDADGLVPGGDDTTQGGFLELSAELIGIGGEGEEALLAERDFALGAGGIPQ